MIRGTFGFRIHRLALIVLTATAALLLYTASPVFSGPYLDSAHGNNTYGVNRARTEGLGYGRGNCAHCHEQHASIGGQQITPRDFMVFNNYLVSECNLICYWCHSAVGGAEQDVDNYPYSVNFGGAPEHYGNIGVQFCGQDSQYANCGSNHNLVAIRNLLKVKRAEWGLPANLGPCGACHNPHLAQRNWNVEIEAGKLKTAMSRPSDHESLWGDDETERMSSYAISVGGVYRAPFYGGNPAIVYEPAGNTTSDGSNMPDYVTFCLDCHKDPQYDPERGATVKAIDWTADRHGEYPANTCNQGIAFEGTLKAPYVDSANSNYVLSCTDCHEPHGAKRKPHLIRRWINGVFVAEDTGTCDSIADWFATCEKCHNIPSDHNLWGACDVCHGHGKTFPGAGPCNNEPTF